MGSLSCSQWVRLVQVASSFDLCWNDMEPLASHTCIFQDDFEELIWKAREVLQKQAQQVRHGYTALLSRSVT